MMHFGDNTYYRESALKPSEEFYFSDTPFTLLSSLFTLLL
jgi:hypothetical protein